MRIKKVKLTKERKILINYDAQSKNGLWDEYSMTCSEQARPEFYAAMEALGAHVVEMCELPENYLAKIKVKGVSFSYAGEKEGVMGATISAQMELKNSHPDLNLNTPHKAEAMYNENTPDDDKQLLSGDCVEALESLQEECKAYISGDRAQEALFNVA
ncbi:MAG: hypothetical protein M0P69_13685 [Bacteroidales bacterium]|nr:hypothetical protein [Bacteroidales bacterium]